MNLLALVESPDHVCCRYRIRAFAPALQDAGWSLTCEGLEQGPLRADLPAPPRRSSSTPWSCSASCCPAWQLRILRRAARHLVFDFDDAVLYRDSNDPRGPESRRRLRRFAADGPARRHGRRRQRLPGRLCPPRGAAGRTRPRDPHLRGPARYPIARPGIRRRGHVDLVWIGSSSTLRGLEQPGAIWIALAEALPAMRLRVICDRFPEDFPDPGRRGRLGRAERSPAARRRPDRRELAAGRPLEPRQVRAEGPPVPGGRPARRGQPGRLPVRDDPLGRGRHPGRDRRRMGRGRDAPGRRLRASTPDGRRRPPTRRGGLFALGLVRDLRQLDDRRPVARLAGSGLEGRSAGRGRRTTRDRSTHAARTQDVSESQTGWRAMSICTPQERSTLARPARPRRPRCRGRPRARSRACSSPRNGNGLVRRDRLVGPSGLGLARRSCWARTASGWTSGARRGRLVDGQVGSASDRLPRRASRGRHLYQALPGPQPPGDPAPVGPPRQGAQRGETVRATGRDRRPDDLADRAGRAAEAEVPVRELPRDPGNRPTRSRSTSSPMQQLPIWPEPRRSRVRQKLASALGVMTARLHDAGFLHEDFHPGNILVRFPIRGRARAGHDRPGRPAARGSRSTGKSACQNLALLDHFFWLRSSRTDRYRFLKNYLENRSEPSPGDPPLRAADRGLDARLGRAALAAMGTAMPVNQQVLRSHRRRGHAGAWRLATWTPARSRR